MAWDCACLLCGNHYIVDGISINNGKSRMCKSCSAKQRSQAGLDKAHEATKKHGLSQDDLYTVFYGMHYRCESKNCKSYPIYGGRGIRVCAEWSKENIHSFFDWAIHHGYKKGLQLDRIDVNGNYSPDNCRWVTHTENANNTRTNRYITVFGETLTLADAVRKYGVVQYKVVHRRIKRGMSVEDALTRINKRA